MSRRKQSNPRQIKRPLDHGLGDEEECVPEENELGATEDLASDRTFSVDAEPESENMDFLCSKDEEEGLQEAVEVEGSTKRKNSLELEDWDGPRELEVFLKDGERQIHSRQALPVGTTWGPFEGKIESSPDGGTLKSSVPVALSSGPRWLLDVTWLSVEDNKNNCIVYSKSGQLWCTTTKPVVQGEELIAFAVDLDSRGAGVSQASTMDGVYPARLLDSIQLLPQQATMASILPTAIVNKDIFPCKACGIWYRSERNLQAHLMYYCGGRQRDPSAGAEDGDGGSVHIHSICPFPQCNKRCVGAMDLEVHLSTHSGVKLEDTIPPGSNLKCTICNYTAESLVTFQHHVLSHLSQAAFRCTHCHISFQNHREFLQHQDFHRLGGGKLHKGVEVELSPGSREESQKQSGTELTNKQDSLQNSRRLQNEDVGITTELEKSEKKPVLSTPKGEASAGSKSSFSYTRIKSEPSSPRLASSPVQHNVGPTFPMGPFLSHFAFSQDLSVAPQASEILAKMSELVHRRLRHGRNSYPPMVYSPLMPKGATCFECNITFNNLDNYLVHKKHYCNSRWQHLAKSHDYSSISDKLAETVSPSSRHGSVSMLSPVHPSEAEGHLMQSACLNSSVFDMINASGKVPDKEISGQVKKATTPPGAEETLNSHQTESKSPNSSLAENESDPSKTTCEACKITFSRHETFMVHKQYYCATRHDPPVKRTSANKLPAVQRTMRSRKRRKTYELSSSDQESRPSVGQPGLFGLPLIGSPCTSQEAVENLGERFYPRCNMFSAMVPKHLEASLTAIKPALVSKCNTASHQETDAPIDLSKKCSPHSDKADSSPKRLLDYHECTVCKISFNKVENYLAHKQNFCPMTSAQHDEFDSLEKAVFSDIKSDNNNFDNIFDKSLVKSDKNGSGRLIAQNGNIFPPHLGNLPGIQAPADFQLLPKEESKNLFLSHCFYPRETKKTNTPEQVSPFYGVKPTDYVNGGGVTPGEPNEQKQSPNEGSEGGKGQPAPNGFAHLSDEPLSQLPKTSTAATTLNESNKPEDTSSGSAPSPPESQPHNSQPSESHPSPTWAPESPGNPQGPPSQKSRTEKATLVAKGLNGSIPVAGGKYCHLCDIQFNSLSNFITHKKFYCTSHSAEHVK
ncbi:zinc finger protein ZFPM2-like [Arapaima gigas]